MLGDSPYRLHERGTHGRCRSPIDLKSPCTRCSGQLSCTVTEAGFITSARSSTFRPTIAETTSMICPPSLSRWQVLRPETKRGCQSSSSAASAVASAAHMDCRQRRRRRRRQQQRRHGGGCAPGRGRRPRSAPRSRPSPGKPARKRGSALAKQAGEPHGAKAVPSTYLLHRIGPLPAGQQH